MHVGGANTLEGDSALRYYINSNCAEYTYGNKLSSCMVFTIGGAFNWRLRMQQSTAQSTTGTQYYAFGIAYTRLMQICHLSKQHSIPTLPHTFSDSVSDFKLDKTESTEEQHLHSFWPSTILLQILLQMDKWTWVMYPLHRCLPSASNSCYRSPPSWSSEV